MQFESLSESQLRQYIDAETVFTAWQKARIEAQSVRGSMFWRELRGKMTLLRVSTTGAQTVIGKDTPDDHALFERFMKRKEDAGNRIKSLRGAVDEQQRLNRALRVGRVPEVVVRILNAINAAGLADHLTTVGTHALFAYEAACGVRIQPSAMMTQDVDLFFDTRQRMAFFSQMERSGASLIGILQKADPSFQVMDEQKQTAMNKKGFQVDVIPRQAKDDDPHPLRMSSNEDDLWAVQIPDAQRIDSASRFSQVIVATTGEMATMHTMDPLAFVRLKQALSQDPKRNPLKRPKDALQSKVVQQLVDEFLQYRGLT